MSYEIKPAAHQGFAIYRDGEFVMWCFSEERAQVRVKELSGS